VSPRAPELHLCEELTRRGQPMFVAMAPANMHATTLHIDDIRPGNAWFGRHRAAAWNHSSTSWKETAMIIEIGRVSEETKGGPIQPGENGLNRKTV